MPFMIAALLKDHNGKENQLGFCGKVKSVGLGRQSKIHMIPVSTCFFKCQLFSLNERLDLAQAIAGFNAMADEGDVRLEENPTPMLVIIPRRDDNIVPLVGRKVVVVFREVCASKDKMIQQGKKEKHIPVSSKTHKKLKQQSERALKTRVRRVARRYPDFLTQ